MNNNPFTPTFGVDPPLLVGRDDLLEDLVDALEGGLGSPGKATLYVGARGTGKTVMLNKAEELARARGWMVISEVATPGLIDRLTKVRLPEILSTIHSEKKTHLTGMTLPLGIGGATWTTTGPEIPLDFRTQLIRATSVLAERGIGLLITIDEVHYKQIADLRDFGSAVQFAFRGKQANFVFVGAGLRSAVSSVLNDSVLTFLQRADRHVLGPVGADDIEAAIREPIEANGRKINPDALAEAASATGGHPFLIQLIGRHIWRQHPERMMITVSDVRSGVAAALRRVGALVFDPDLAALSDIDRSFLVAMAQDDVPSKTTDICTRLGVDATYVGQYRLRLIEAGMISAVRHGEVTFVQPFLRGYLREHAAAIAPDIIGRVPHTENSDTDTPPMSPAPKGARFHR
ncbi:MAG: ATP-binding protein [Ferrimicrobium sp.]